MDSRLGRDSVRSAEKHLKTADHMIGLCNEMYSKENSEKAISCFGQAIEEFGKYLREDDKPKRAAKNMLDFMMRSTSLFSGYMVDDFSRPSVSVKEFTESAAKNALEGFYFLTNDVTNLVISKCDTMKRGRMPVIFAHGVAMRVAEIRTLAVLENGDAHFKLLEYTRNWNAAYGPDYKPSEQGLTHLVNTYDEAYRYADLVEKAWGPNDKLEFYKDYAHNKKASAEEMAENLIRR